MRILQINSAATRGGGETHVLELAAELRRRGHQVTLAGRPGGPLRPDHALPFRNALDLATALRLRRILREGNIEVAHAHLGRDYPLVAAAAWGLPGVRVVCTRHLLLPVGRFPPYRALYRRIDGWLAPTAQILDQINEQINARLAGLRPRRSAVIPNWVDVSQYPPPARSPRPAATLGLLGQIAPHKGHDDAVDALRRLGPPYRLLIAGQGEPRYLAALRRRAAGLEVTFAGVLPAPAFFPRIDILLVPSWEEPFGLVVLEAMAAGVPVVATDRGGPRAILQAGRDGWLVEPRQPAALAAAVERLAGDDALRAELVRAARQRVEREFDLAPTVARIAAFYAELIGYNGVPPPAP